jgi:hypothetical protein
MRVLTIRNPWAWAIFHGKDVENRPRNLAGEYRGPVAIHAGLSFAESVPLGGPLQDALDAAGPVPSFYAGQIIGVVDLVDVHHCFNADTNFEGCSPWAEPDAWHLVLANPRPLTSPIPFKGALHLQTAPEGLEADIVRQIGPLG